MCGSREDDPSEIDKPDIHFIMPPAPEVQPHPYLTREETNERMEVLGFEFSLNWTLKPGQEAKFVALQELIAGAIAEWADVKDDFREAPGPNDPKWNQEGDQTPEDINNELNDWAQEYLVG